MSTTSNVPVVLGPWGGPGGQAFDDGWSNSGISKVVIYHLNYLRGLRVHYANGKTILHGGAVGTSVEIDATSKGLTDIIVSIGRNQHFSGNFGVVALGFSASTATTLPSTPSNAEDVVTYHPRILGFFGRASAGAIDQLGVYVSNDHNN